MTNKMLLAVVVVAVVAVAAVGAYFLLSSDNSDDNEKASVKFLIQDDKGIYFWIEGEGDTIGAAFGNAASAYEIPNTLDGDSNVLTLFGMEEDWATMYWNDGWKVADKDMKDTSSADVNFVCFKYSGDPLADAGDAKVLDKDPSGIKFLIQSPTGMYFKMGASGANAGLALKAACERYGYDENVTESNTYGWSVNWLFNDDLSTKLVGADYFYWSQFTYNSSTPAGWDKNSTGFGSITAATLNGAYLGVCYGPGLPPSVSPFGEKSIDVVWDDLDNEYTTSLQSAGVEITGKLSVIEGNPYSFTVNTTTDNLTDTVLTVKYSINGGAYTTLSNNGAGPLYSYTTPNVTGSLNISVIYTGNIVKVFDISGIAKPVHGEDPADLRYSLFISDGTGYSLKGLWGASEAYWTDADDVMLPFDTDSYGTPIYDDPFGYGVYKLYIPLDSGFLSFTNATTYEPNAGYLASMDNPNVDFDLSGEMLVYTFTIGDPRQ